MTWMLCYLIPCIVSFAPAIEADAPCTAPGPLVRSPAPPPIIVGVVCEGGRGLRTPCKESHGNEKRNEEAAWPTDTVQVRFISLYILYTYIYNLSHFCYVAPLIFETAASMHK